nr:unnamed protein product [Digitaria exilis]
MSKKPSGSLKGDVVFKNPRNHTHQQLCITDSKCKRKTREESAKKEGLRGDVLVLADGHGCLQGGASGLGWRLAAAGVGFARLGLRQAGFLYLLAVGERSGGLVACGPVAKGP